MILSKKKASFAAKLCSPRLSADELEVMQAAVLQAYIPYR
jgi:hypothetical protein